MKSQENQALANIYGLHLVSTLSGLEVGHKNQHFESSQDGLAFSGES